MSEQHPFPHTSGEVTGPIQITPRELRPTSRVGGQLRRAAVRVVRSSSPPTLALGLRTDGDGDISQQHARAVIDLALRVGEAVLSTGASAADTVATVLRLAQAYGIESVHVDITYTSISVSIHRGLEEDSLTVMRIVTGRALDHTRLEGVHRLIREIVSANRPGGPGIDVDTARGRLKSLLTAPHPYQRWVVTLGVSVMSVGVVLLFGSGPVIVLVAALSGALVDRVQRQLFLAGIPAFFTQAACAAIPAFLALLLFAYGGFAPSAVVVAGIVILLAGLGVLGAAQDALDGYYVTAGARGLEVLLMTLGIAVGVSAVIGIGSWFDVSMEANAMLLLDRNLVVSTFGAVLIAVGFCLTTYSGRRATVISVLIAALTWLLFEAAQLSGFATPAAVAVAATAAGALAYAAYRRLRVPEAAVATASIVSMLPGLAVYRGLYLIMQNNPATVGQAVLHFMGALSTGIGLAGGLVLGAYLARGRFGLDVAGKRARRRSRGSYLGG